jgi:predicted nucleic acid-binding protein
MIIDTNVIIQFYFEDKPTSLDLYKYQLEAPSFIKIELINVLRKAHFLNNVPIKTLDQVYNDSLALISIFHDHEVLLDLAKEISFRLNHPIYDCLFLALALKLNMPFLSSDTRLLAKADSLGIQTVNYSKI